MSITDMNIISYWEAFEKRCSEKHDRPMPTRTTLPLRIGNKIVGKELIFFSNHPGNKRLTIERIIR